MGLAVCIWKNTRSYARSRANLISKPAHVHSEAQQKPHAEEVNTDNRRTVLSARADTDQMRVEEDVWEEDGE